MIHKLKILPEYFEIQKSGLRQFEIRKNDRGFKVADEIVLREWDGKNYTGRILNRSITCIFGDNFEGIERGFCVIGTMELIKA
jgi:ASC-1-like (ASCH) protein